LKNIFTVAKTLPSSSFLIAGSDTGVGKTILTAALVAYYQTFYRSNKVAVYKPIQSGIGDREYLQTTLRLTQTLEQINPIFFDQPIASAIATYRENKAIDLGLIWQQYQVLQAESDFLLVESMGGLGSPITSEYLVADLAKDWRIPVILVVPLRLGAIGQAIANLALANQKQLQVIGIVLSCNDFDSANHLEDWAPINLIENLTNTAVIGLLPHINDLSDRHALSQAAAQLNLGYIWNN
jgi:dethiobiotin synthetase